MILQPTTSRFATVADLYKRFGAMPLDRIRFNPWPGTATEEDVVAIHDRENRLYELVDGVLLEKSMGAFESYLGLLLGRLIGNHVDKHKLGIVLGADGMLRLSPGLVRIPDVSFISWKRLGDHRLGSEAIAPLSPDLAVEVISASNSTDEMDDKLDDYFGVNVRLVWYVYPHERQVHVYASGHTPSILSTNDVLDGGDVLPGFVLDLKTFFSPPVNPNRP